MFGVVFGLPGGSYIPVRGSLRNGASHRLDAGPLFWSVSG